MVHAHGPGENHQGDGHATDGVLGVLQYPWWGSVHHTNEGLNPYVRPAGSFGPVAAILTPSVDRRIHEVTIVMARLGDMEIWWKDEVGVGGWLSLSKPLPVLAHRAEGGAPVQVSRKQVWFDVLVAGVSQAKMEQQPSGCCWPCGTSGAQSRSSPSCQMSLLAKRGCRNSLTRDPAERPGWRGSREPRGLMCNWPFIGPPAMCSGLVLVDTGADSTLLYGNPDRFGGPQRT